MEMTMNMGAFKPLTSDEILLVDGGGPGTIFLSTLGIAWSPVVACVNPPAGLALFGTSVGLLVDNCRQMK